MLRLNTHFVHSFFASPLTEITLAGSPSFKKKGKEGEKDAPHA